MGKKAAAILSAIFIFVLCCCLYSTSTAVSDSTKPSVITTDTVSISLDQQYDVVQPDGKSALAIRFGLKKDWHFYASTETAPGGMNLKINPAAAGYINFSEPIFPESHLYFDKSLGKKLEVFSGRFTVFVPFSIDPDVKAQKAAVKIGIEGAVCSDIQCRIPDFGQLEADIKIAADADMTKPKFALPDLTKRQKPIAVLGRTGYSVWFALGLAFLAGLSLNIMPCVWPVLPIIVMRIVEQAKQSKGRSITMGFAFCLGILLFFACLAGANIILQVFYGTVLQWGDQFRNPAFVAGMALLLVVLALFMFGVFTITVPSSISGKSAQAKGYTGAVGMGFLAAILSTPCSFAILAAAFAWAQTQPLLLATLAIMIIGVGMAVPYAILTSVPALLKRVPKPGRWMEMFKQAIGFVLLVIAIKLITALPQLRRAGVLYFAVVLGFSVWMWGSWVSHNTKLSRKFVIRVLAAVLTVAAGWIFLRAPKAELIGWQKYDAGLIDKALAENRPVLIKFTADWCLSCQVVEKTVYSRQDIAELIEQKGVLTIKADTTVKDYPATVALKNIYNEPGVPVSILYVPGEEKTVRWHSMSFADELKMQLEELSAR